MSANARANTGQGRPYRRRRRLRYLDALPDKPKDVVRRAFRPPDHGGILQSSTLTARIFAMHELLLTPSDVLSSRWRPWTASLTGRTRLLAPSAHPSTPPPCRASLRRSRRGAHKPARGRSGCYLGDERTSVFGSLKSIGPFGRPGGNVALPDTADLVLDGGRIRLGCKPVPFDRAENPPFPKPLNPCARRPHAARQDNKPGAWISGGVSCVHQLADTTTLDKSAYNRR